MRSARPWDGGYYRPRVAGTLALDIGTSSVRALVFDDAAGERAARGGSTPGRTILSLAELVRGAIEEAAARDFDAVGASCFGHSLLALDDNGPPLTPILGWRDTRSADGRLARSAASTRRGARAHRLPDPHELLAGEVRVARTGTA